MFTGSGPIKESFKYSIETQFEANADTKIGSAAVEHLQSSFEKVGSPEGRSCGYLSFISPPRPRKRSLFKKVWSSVGDIKETIFLSNCRGLRLYKYYKAILVTIRLAVFAVGRQGKRSEKLFMLMK